MKFLGKICFKIIVKVTKNQDYTLSLEDTFFEKAFLGLKFNNRDNRAMSVMLFVCLFCVHCPLNKLPFYSITLHYLFKSFSLKDATTTVIKLIFTSPYPYNAQYLQNGHMYFKKFKFLAAIKMVVCTLKILQQMLQDL